MHKVLHLRRYNAPLKDQVETTLLVKVQFPLFRSSNSMFDPPPPFEPFATYRKVTSSPR
jgi:hypothetical protein